MSAGSDFKRFYDAELRPELVELERRRVSICRAFAGAAVLIGAVVAVVLVVVGAALAGAAVAIAAIAAGLGIAVGWVIWRYMTRTFVSDFKRKVIGRIVEYCHPELRYSPEGAIPKGQFMGSQIFTSRIDRYRGEDHVRGRLDETQVAFSEVHAQRRVQSGKSSHYETVFKGLFFVAEFNKHFRGVTVVLPDVAERSLGWLGQKLQEWNVTRRGELVKLEDPEFEREFVVYGTDQVEARYVLSSALMERICRFRKKAGRQVFLSFARSKVYVAVRTGRNMFEPRVFGTVLDFGLATQYWRDLSFILGIVDDLDLNTRIWTKE